MAIKRNMDPKKCPMPSQDPNVRNKNFKEVALGYTYEMAVNEAKRCLNCPKKPCRSACPVQIDIPAFIACVANEDMEGAYKVLTASSALPAVCGRVCPQESQCEGKCVRGIKGEPVAIGRLERFVADWHREHSTELPEVPAPNGHKVAVIGAGPSGLTAAGDLAKLGRMLAVPVGNEALQTANGHRLALDAAHALALALALLRADTAADSRQRGALGQNLKCTVQVFFCNLTDKGRNVDADRAAGLAGLFGALQAAAGLVNSHIIGIAQSYFLEVLVANLGRLARHRAFFRIHISLKTHDY